jgi:hypothetical protein
MKNGNIGVTIFLFLLAIILLGFAIYQSYESEDKEAEQYNHPVQIEPEINPEIIQNEVSSSTDGWTEFFSSKRLKLYPKELVTPPSLIAACQNPRGSGVVNQEKCNKEVANITKIVDVTKQPTTDAWLYMKVGVSRGQQPIGPIKTDYDAVWLFLDDGAHSGHIYLAGALESRTSEDGFTEFLFKLNDVAVTDLPYSTTNPINKRGLNLLEQLRPGKHYFASFVSTLGYGRIQSAEIGFRDGDLRVVN